MFLLFRTLVYATLFIGLLLVYVPARLLAWSDIACPSAFGWPQIGGMLIAIAGGIVAFSCVAAFIRLGRGTPAPFDPPRRLVVRGPYRLVRNPMYIGALLAMAGAALYFRSAILLAYCGAFLLVAHLFVVLYEEPALRRSFGSQYETYCHSVSRWLPRAGTKQ